MDQGEGARPDQLPLFLTTEHFTLQTARSAAFVELNGRLQVFLTTLSSSIVALALAAQISGLGDAFLAFALVLLPTDYVLGLMTLGRLRQVQDEALLYAQGMNRIRRYFLDAAPESQRYLILSSTDDPWRTLSSLHMGGSRWTTGLVTRNAVVVLVNSVVAGVVAGLVAHALEAPPTVIAVVAAVVGLGSLGGLGVLEQRNFMQRMRRADVAFPSAGGSHPAPSPPPGGPGD